MSAGARLHLGCPFWSFAPWAGGLFSRDARPSDFLGQYASVWNAVEGNTTFYRVPTPDTVRRWREATPPDFRFCFKLPREITHERRLLGVGREVAGFLTRLDPLAERLGPLLVQLPPAFGPDALPELERLLAARSTQHAWAVELRHPDFFDAGPWERRVDALLARHGCDRVWLDSRALRSGPAGDPDVVAARRRKPDLPFRDHALGPRPIVRFVGHEDESIGGALLDAWAERLAGWLAEGRTPFFFLHTPTNRRSPERLRRFRERVARRVPLPPLAAFRGESGESASGQLSWL